MTHGVNDVAITVGDMKRPLDDREIEPATAAAAGIAADELAAMREGRT